MDPSENEVEKKYIYKIDELLSLREKGLVVELQINKLLEKVQVFRTVFFFK